ncbi:metallophosphoesterase 1 homolog [Ischnura elegans]|uniref:metallophosphoesterase 1 homolog n=1 Tax=Ischnura elegans TaxID=197161 RepID=UPI001ED8AA83|nr:metallophosphoesterase 1 homolog [Ischnura elegans]
MKLRGRPKLLVICFILVIIFYIEHVSYFTNAWNWPSIKCSSSQCLKLLLVADPQILGEKTESAIARWDCDRYLSKNFLLALNHVKPDIILFLGDLMDEGSRASADEYSRYKERFFSIYRTDGNVKMLFIPGDNDIGGEMESVTSAKLERYRETFGEEKPVNIGFAEFIKVNRLIESFPHEKVNTPLSTNLSRILLSHLPILPASGGFVDRVITQLHPQLIFSAHDHKSFHFDADIDVRSGKIVGHYRVFPLGGSEVALKTAAAKKAQGKSVSSWMFYLGDSIVHEIMVPTCSYRMGVPYMGFGAATLSPLVAEGVEVAYEDEYDSVDGITRDSGKMVLHYSVLWLPSRLPQLTFYIVFACVSAVGMLIWRVSHCGTRSFRG